MTYISSHTNKSTEFNLNISKKDIQFNKQSAANNIISNDEINTLCKNISTIKVSMKDTILSVFKDIIVKFEDFQPQIDVIINFVTIIDVIFSKTVLSKNIIIVNQPLLIIAINHSLMLKIYVILLLNNYTKMKYMSQMILRLEIVLLMVYCFMEPTQLEKPV